MSNIVSLDVRLNMKNKVCEPRLSYSRNCNAGLLFSHSFTTGVYILYVGFPLDLLQIFMSRR